MVSNKSWKILLTLGIGFNALSPSESPNVQLTTREEHMFHIAEQLSESTDELEQAVSQMQELSQAINKLDTISQWLGSWDEEAIKWGRFGGLDIDKIQKETEAGLVSALIRKELNYEPESLLPALQELAKVVNVKGVKALSAKDRVYTAIKSKMHELAVMTGLENVSTLYTSEKTAAWRKDPSTFNTCEEIIQARLEKDYTLDTKPQLSADIELGRKALEAQNLYKNSLLTQSKLKTQLEAEIEQFNQLTKIIDHIEKRRISLLSTGTDEQRLRIAQTARDWFRLRSDHAEEFKKLTTANESLRSTARRIIELKFDLAVCINAIEKNARSF